VNERGKVMDVKDNRDVEQQNIQVWNKHSGLNQQWNLIFADEYPADPKKGELNQDLGLFVERPFYIVSQMDEHRYVDVNDSQIGVIKTRNGNPTQVWYFDQNTLTIRSKQFNRAMEVQSDGASTKWRLQSIIKTACW
jgi:hypothetical protein